MKFDVTNLTYREIEKVMERVRGTPFYISKLGENIIVNTGALVG
ncbi:MAG: hypothetical protein Q8R15_01915 [Candidatus Micrarchaeota archaeon]|nr:hypothetical protein [Candidatus Micrarchaeota archaeon]